MRNPVQFLAIVTVLVLVIDFYAFQAFKTAFKDSSEQTQKIVKWAYWGFTAIVLIIFISSSFLNSFKQPSGIRMYFIAVIMLLLVSKLFIIFFLLIDDISRLFRWVFSLFQKQEALPSSGTSISRYKFISQVAIFVGLLPLVLGLDGMIRNAYNYKYRRIKIKLPNLPESFNGLKIIQLSDIHSGSFTDDKPIIKAIEKINKEEADLIFFTGDLVNNLATEVEPYKDIFGKLRAKEGVFSILGNHDYGDYVKWDSKEAKQANLTQLKQHQKDMGWQLLLDENKLLQRGEDSLAIIGVQNWSTKMHFPKYGNLSKAVAGSEKAAVKLLLSHDPSHWDAQIKPEFNDIDITFSGHTHGAQLGVEIPGWRWSPSKYIYKQWADLYQEGKQYLYVNRGFGFIGYPGRVGIMPEVTIIELQRA